LLASLLRSNEATLRPTYASPHFPSGIVKCAHIKYDFTIKHLNI
jgi:hypothetical protein